MRRLDAPDAGELPTMGCGDAATEPPWDSFEDTSGITCPLPPSHCVDWQWLVSYVNGVCEDGVCRYWRVLHDCRASGGSSCVRDHCQVPISK